MRTELAEKLHQKYQLESELLFLEQRKACLDECLPEAKYALREAKVAAVEYEGFTFRGFLDQLSGKKAEKLEALQRQAAHAQEKLQNLEREQALNQEKINPVLSQLETLRALGDPIDQAYTLEKEERESILLLEAKLATKKLLPALEETEEALQSAREWARPHNRIEAIPGYTKSQLYSQADKGARICYDCLERIARCGILLEIHPYFQNPAGYIVGVAAQYAELDRINSALIAIWDTKTQANELLSQLSDEENR